MLMPGHRHSNIFANPAAYSKDWILTANKADEANEGCVQEVRFRYAKAMARQVVKDLAIPVS